MSLQQMMSGIGDNARNPRVNTSTGVSTIVNLMFFCFFFKNNYNFIYLNESKIFYRIVLFKINAVIFSSYQRKENISVSTKNIIHLNNKYFLSTSSAYEPFHRKGDIFVPRTLYV